MSVPYDPTVWMWCDFCKDSTPMDQWVFIFGEDQVDSIRQCPECHETFGVEIIRTWECDT